jgi:CHAT domain-containing protein
VTKREVLQRAANADLLYFAAHGYSDASNPLDGSFLMLGDGRLTAREVQSQTFTKHPLVVLSACQTGEGKIIQAGVIGLARAFQIAGASNTVMSLWTISDEATATLMGYFVDALKTKEPAEALREAMLKLKATQPDPFGWAAFNVFGNRGFLSKAN